MSTAVTVIDMKKRVPLNKLSLLASSVAMALVASLGFAPAAQAEPNVTNEAWLSASDFEYTYGGRCGPESGVVEFMLTDIGNNSPHIIEVLITLDLDPTDELPGETVESQVLNPGESMPDVILPFPFLSVLEVFAADPAGVEANQLMHSAYYNEFHSCVDPVITFEEHGGTEVTDPQCVDGEQFEIPAAPTRDGYTFAGWNSAADGTGTAYEVGSMHDCLGLITIHATWAESEVAPVEVELPIEVELPNTGSESTLTIRSAVALSIVGLALLALSRRPRTHL